MKRFLPLLGALCMVAILFAGLHLGRAQGQGSAVTLPDTHAHQPQPDFSMSHKTGPLFAKTGDVITYTIVAVSAGGAVQNVVLSDTLPGGVVFVPGSCTYDDGDGIWNCNSLDQMWRENFPPGGRITTTFTVTVTPGTLRLPLINHAFLGWADGQQEMVFTTTVLSTAPDFTSSYKHERNPQPVETGDVITYTIVAVNAGDPVTDVVLSDLLPSGVVFVSGSCTYKQPGTLYLPCNDDFPAQSQVVWREDLTHSTRITTTFAVTVEAGTLQFPLRNCAYLNWDVVQEEMCSTTTVNSHIYLPLLLRDYAVLANGDFEDQLVGWSTGGTLRVEAVTGLYAGALPPSITGRYAARLGGDDSVYSEGQVPIGYGALWQTFSVPDIPNPAITIRYRVATHDVVYGTRTRRYFDDFEVAIDQRPWEITDDSVRDAAGCSQTSPVPSVIDMSSGGLAFCDGNRTGPETGTASIYDTGWHTVTLRLGPSLRQKNVTLYLANFNRLDHRLNTWTYVDEIGVNW